jgi:Leucine-rich repeat (LRR) protein
LSENRLETLPSEIGGLKNLKSLYVNKNRLRELPSEIGDLDNLNSLIVSSNKISSLPIELTKLQRLSMVELLNNPLDNSLDLKNLEVSTLFSFLNRSAKSNKFPKISLKVEAAYRTLLFQQLLLLKEYLAYKGVETWLFEIKMYGGGLSIHFLEKPASITQVINQLQEFLELPLRSYQVGEAKQEDVFRARIRFFATYMHESIELQLKKANNPTPVIEFWESLFKTIADSVMVEGQK